jgi:hypothetical protein
MTNKQHYVTYADDLADRNGNRWVCLCAAEKDHDQNDPNFLKMAKAAHVESAKTTGGVMLEVSSDELASLLGADQDERGNGAPVFAGVLLHPKQAKAIADAILSNYIVLQKSGVADPLYDDKTWHPEGKTPARVLRQCAICGEMITMSNATEGWEEAHATITSSAHV